MAMKCTRKFILMIMEMIILIILEVQGDDDPTHFSPNPTLLFFFSLPFSKPNTLKVLMSKILWS